MKKTYALIVQGTGELYTITGENITCQALYKRALSIRRECKNNNWKQDEILLMNADNGLVNGELIQKWSGGTYTPITDTPICIPDYNFCKRNRITRMYHLLNYLDNLKDLNGVHLTRAKRLISIVKPYSIHTAQHLTRLINLKLRCNQ